MNSYSAGRLTLTRRPRWLSKSVTGISSLVKSNRAAAARSGRLIRREHSLRNSRGRRRPSRVASRRSGSTPVAHPATGSLIGKGRAGSDSKRRDQRSGPDADRPGPLPILLRQYARTSKRRERSTLGWPAGRKSPRLTSGISPIRLSTRLLPLVAGQVDREGGTRALRRFHLNAPPVRADDPLDDIQSQAEVARRAPAHGFEG